MNEERIERAACNMEAAAESMRMTFNFLQQTIDDNRRYADEWISRFEQAVRDHSEAIRKLKESE